MTPRGLAPPNRGSAATHQGSIRIASPTGLQPDVLHALEAVELRAFLLMIAWPTRDAPGIPLRHSTAGDESGPASEKVATKR
jgi:hypothetical protein